jgi:hypothetical protein
VRKLLFACCLLILVLAAGDCAGRTQTVTLNATAYATTVTTAVITVTGPPASNQTVTVTVTPTYQQTDDRVTPAEARIAAQRLLIHPVFSTQLKWEGGILSEPVLFYAFDMTQAVYEFTVLRDGKGIGCIMIAGRKDWMPSLEMSDGAAPSSYAPQALAVAVAQGYVAPGENATPVFFYGGATFGSVQFGEKMKAERKAVELGYGFGVVTLPEKAPKLMFDPEQARAGWAKIIAEAGG